ncbi:FixH family protein [Salinicoccus roseus]|uniref:FixH family protein n=1 Tax=Salinicoccus roseus TaxID=45670 RepID=UPI001EF56ABD|nr:FixH family protein [Salinicoccus roseus]MCG7331614.1 FixH family protein [Salinicoccus roseus]
MKSKFMMFAMMLSVALLTACGNSGETETEMNHDNPSEDEVHALEVDLEVPETAEAGDTVEFSAHVHSNGEDITDADKVMYEVLSGEESLEKIEAEHDQNGVYTIEYTFEEAGTYTVISHVDALRLHTMPQSDITVQ